MLIDNGGVACEPAPDCAVCGGPGALLHDGLTDTLFSAPGVWAMRRCAPCGLGWLDPQPRRSEISKFYAAYWTHASDEGDVPPQRNGRRWVKAVLAALVFRTHGF